MIESSQYIQKLIFAIINYMQIFDFALNNLFLFIRFIDLMENYQNSAGQFLSPANQVFPRTRSVIISSQSPRFFNPVINSQGAVFAENKIPQSRHEQNNHQTNWSQIVDTNNRQASLSNLRSSKYQNKYSFKKYTKSKMLALANPEGDHESCIKQLNQYKFWLIEKDTQINQYQAYLAQRDRQLAQIRDISFHWQSKHRQSYLFSIENAEYINCLTEIYNISIAGQKNKYSELAFVKANQSAQGWHSEKTQTIKIKEIGETKKESLIGSLPQNSNSIFQIKGLRQQIQNLERERFTLINKIQYFERNSGGLQESIDSYRYQIDNLKIQLRELVELKLKCNELSQHLNSKDNQLALTQKHIVNLEQRIIYLSNISPEKDRGNDQTEYHSSLEIQVRNLRQTISKYTEDIEQIQLQKRKYQQLLNQRQLQSAHLTSEFNKLQTCLEEAKNKEVEIAHSKDITDSPHLLEQMNRLNARFNEQGQSLQKAEDYIIVLQNLLERSNHSQQQNLNKLKSVQEQYNRNLTIITQKYQTEISNLSATIKINSNSQMLNSEKQIRELKQQVSQLIVIHQQFRKKNEDLTRERDDLLVKNLQFQKQSQIKVSSPSKNKETRELEEKINHLNLQLSDTTGHLKKAELYIEQNLKAWTSKKQIEVQHGQKLAFLEHLTKDFELLKTQNQELSIRLVNFETIVEEHSFFKSEYERLLLVLKQYEQNPSQSQQLKFTKGNYEKVLLALRQVQVHLVEVNPLEQLKQLQNSRIQLQAVTEQLQKVKKENISLNLKLSSHNSLTTELQMLKQKEIIMNTQKKMYEQVHVKKTQHIQVIANSATSTNVVYMDSLVQDIKKLKNQNQQLTEQLRDKDGLLENNKSRLIETEKFIQKYTRLLEESHTQLRTAQNEIINLKNEVAKIPQLQQYLQRAESFIIEQEQKHKQVIINYENSQKQLKSHLEGAEHYIITLEDNYNKLAFDQTEFDKLKADNEGMNEALIKANNQIHNLEKQIKINNG